MLLFKYTVTEICLERNVHITTLKTDLWLHSVKFKLTVLSLLGFKTAVTYKLQKYSTVATTKHSAKNCY